MPSGQHTCAACQGRAVVKKWLKIRRLQDSFANSAAAGRERQPSCSRRAPRLLQMASNSPGNDAPHDAWGPTNAEGEGHAPVLWRFLNGPREAFCLLHPHPIGFELRYMLTASS